MHRNSPRLSRLGLFALGAFAYACSGGGGGCGGCGGTDGGPPYVFEGNSEDHVVFQGGQVHVTQDGLDRISDNLDVLIGTLLGDGGLSFCLPETDITVATLCGDETCDDGSTGCQLDIGLENVRVIPQRTSSPSDDRIRVEIELQLDEVLSTSGFVSCDIGLSTPSGLPVAANLYMNLDPPEWERVHIDFPSEELEYDLNDLDINISGGVFGSCAILNTVTGLVTGLIGDQIGGMIDDAIGPALCTSCASGEMCPVGSTCDGESCIVDGTAECVPLALGVEMAFDLGDLLADFAPGLEAELGILAYAANYADAMGPPGSGLAYEGIDLGLELGFYSEADPCVPYAAPPATDRVAKSPGIYTDTTPAGDPFGVGIGVSRSSLNLAGWALYRSGALCLSIGSETVEQIATGTFSVLLPSLGDLVGGENRPMYLQLRPQRPVTFDLGLGTVTEGGAIDDPLITVNLDDLDIDFYVFTEDRYVRLMTLNTDVAVPLTLDVNDASQLVIVLGDLSAAFGAIEVRNGELLSERDAGAVATVLPTLIGGLLPTLVGDALAPIDLPEIAEGVSLVIPPGGITSVDSRQMLAIFADLAFGAPAPKAAPVRPAIAAMSVERATGDEIAAMLASDAGIDLAVLTPTVTLEMDTFDPVGGVGGLEYSYRIDNGLWNAWQRGDRLVIEDPTMALSGTYVIDVQARRVGEPLAAFPNLATTTVTIDYVPPTIAVEANEGIVTATVTDLHSPDGLSARYRVDEGAWTRLPLDGAIDLGAWLGSTVVLEVEAVDAMGNRAASKSTLALGSGSYSRSGDAATEPGQSGCSTTGGPAGGMTLLLGLLGLGLLRRRGAAVIATAVLGLALGACGDDEKNRGEGGRCDPACEDGQSCVEGVCVDDPCVTDDDCDAGQTCDDGTCVDAGPCTTDEECPENHICDDGECALPTACTEDAQCGEGRYCDEGGVCRAFECVEDGDCGDCGEFETPRCTDNACTCEVPCADGCAEGSVCCEPQDTCVALTATCEPKACDRGFHVQPVADPVFDAATCEVTVECECVEMPPLPLGSTGVYLDIGVSVAADTRAIAAYNATYGDLMVGIVDDADAIEWEFVDGLSDDDTVTGSLTGPRGGVAVAGPDVGQYPSVAVGDDGALHVAYYAATGDFRRSLLYAYGAPSGGGYTWSFLQLDAADGAGRYTDIELDPATGFPTLGYVVPAVRQEDGTYQSQVRVAQASSAAPTAAEDWAAPVVVVAETSPFPCGASCVGRQQCRLDLNVCASTERASECAEDCGDGACFANEGGAASCAATDSGRPSGPATVFEGIGLFLDMEFLPEGALGFAFYDRTNGNLVTASTSAATPALTVGTVLDGEAFDEGAGEVVDTGDAGWYPDLFVTSGGGVFVSYAEASTGVLRIADLVAGTTTPVDDGVRCYEFDAGTGECTAPLRLRVGYDSAIAEQDGDLFLVYQDATWHEILESPLGEFGWDLPGTVAQPGDPYTGAYGFYLGHGVGADGRFVVSYRLNQRATPPVRDTVVIAR